MKRPSKNDLKPRKKADERLKNRLNSTRKNVAAVVGARILAGIVKISEWSSTLAASAGTAVPRDGLQAEPLEHECGLKLRLFFFDPCADEKSGIGEKKK
ncbi:MAG: hypothetical protein ACP5FH_08175 [Terracidiphilus sp.]